MRYFLDTNILLAYLRKHHLVNTLQTYFEDEGGLSQMFTSAVCIGELTSIGIQNNWGKQKMAALDSLKDSVLITTELNEQIVERYAEIDAFSQGRLRERHLKGSARNMGKNDLWIAATASILNATLITTDKDFDHLNSEFLNVARFELI
ncbi:type II toxin-antitoxin system VapC family toxin [Dyadobacter fanqingshengii]|uniref:Type II toxin-antitoxin system VapC family toxin n=1 Tax=Dyadobacter fanqingshengii TaxID=2906443 RepID=A0A9X1TC56_9BACT|nr:type II toxin-antitoxin system VapC family toxin [Dyadobacter fanqingshengii]MCF0042769.1 type II toxin-antitoxin system VapC family toxin [Dyadobacter fanqingshengii]USJ36009.1 type II toxin-antitoxin system VapC family toxin [Dyadobacter fanqingshengii]